MSRCLSAVRKRSSCALAFGVCLVTSVGLANDWPGFRGKRVDGTVDDTSVFRGSDAVALKVAWKRAIGSGYSGISIADGRVVTMFSDGKSDVAAAFDEKSGEELWRFDVEKTYEGHDGSHTGPISTPLINDGRVFALGAWGRLVALDLASGKLLWATHLADDHKAKKPHYGFGTSPLMIDGVLVVQLGGENGAVAGFDPATGKRLWAVGEDEVGYQSPIPYAFDNAQGVLSPGQKKLLFVNPASGSLGWEYEHGGGGARGAASLVPVPAGDDRLFLAFKDDASTVIELVQGETGIEAKPLWEDRCVRNSYNVPVYHDGYIYAYSSRFLTCVDPASGEAKWKSREPGDGFVILVDGHLVIVTKSGSVHVAEASPSEYTELGHVEVFDDLAWSHPSFANDHIFVRSLGELARISIRPGVEVAEKGPERDPLLTGTQFGYFLTEVAKAEDKKAVIDRFLSAQKEFPIIEGQSLVHFVYRGPADDMAIAGDMIGARQERPMRRVEGTDLFYYSTRLEPDARVNYMFIKDYKSMLDPRNDRKCTTTVYDDEMEMNFGDEEIEMSWMAMPKWEMPAYLDGGTPEATGRIEAREFESTALEAEGGKPTIAIDVYLPAGYETSKQRYPVAYVHGGEDARERGQLDKMLDYAIGKSVRPVIVVFINFSPMFGQQGYDKMVVEELVPFVDENYRTIASREARAHVGAGFAGFLASVCAFQHSDTASMLGSQSAVLFGSMADMITAAIPPAADNPMTIYFEWGKYDLRNPHENWSMADENRSFADALKTSGYTIKGGEIPDGTGWSSWRNRTERVFAALFPLRKRG